MDELSDCLAYITNQSKDEVNLRPGNNWINEVDIYLRDYGMTPLVIPGTALPELPITDYIAIMVVDKQKTVCVCNQNSIIYPKSLQGKPAKILYAIFLLPSAGSQAILDFESVDIRNDCFDDALAMACQLLATNTTCIKDSIGDPLTGIDNPHDCTPARCAQCWEEYLVNETR